jgi:electron transfer flavoprotein alpha subunit
VGAVLVLVERSPSDGTVRRSTCALLTIARRLGTPVAVLCGAADDDAVALLGRYGAEKICVAGPWAAGPCADVLVGLARRMDPAAVLITSGYTGQEVAARVAVRLDSGIITDAVDIRLGSSGLTAVQVCLAASYLVVSDVVRGVPVITVRPEAAAPEAAPVEPVVEPVDIEAGTAVPSARLVSRVPRP